MISDDDALDPYSARVAHAFERVGPAVAHVAAIDPEDPEVRRLFQREINAYNGDKPHHEQIRAFAVLSSDLTIEDGSITPTLKVKRRILESRYHDLIDHMYRKAEESHVA